MKKFMLPVILAGVLSLAAAGGTLAADSARTAKPLQADVAAKALEIALLNGGEGPGDELTYTPEKVLMPGDEVVPGEKGLFMVENRRTVPSYGRVALYACWLVPEGEKWRQIALSPKELQEVIKLDEQAWLVQDTGAALGEMLGDSVTLEENVLHCYYRTPMEAEGGCSTPLVQRICLPVEYGNEYMGRRLVLTAKANGVQYLDGQDSVNRDAILASWGVEATLSRGSIAAVQE